jgi:hypothetical protein
MSFSVLLHRRKIERQRPIESPARDIAPDHCLCNILHFSILILHFAFSPRRFCRGRACHRQEVCGQEEIEKVKMQNAKCKMNSYSRIMSSTV